MALRYIEFAKVDGKQVQLDIVQISLKEKARCFHIYVRSETEFQFVICKDNQQNWEVITEEIPRSTIMKLFEFLIPSIELRLALENDYLGSN